MRRRAYVVDPTGGRDGRPLWSDLSERHVWTDEDRAKSKSPEAIEKWRRANAARKTAPSKAGTTI